ncbi:MAG: LytR C-terminal domain-containing protein [Actinomycetota bacterium]|nr:LytR C-terminal domain-containing protein [Actinomycetota bacterium]
MNLSPARLAVLVALVVGGIAVILNGFGDDDAVLADSSTGVAQPSASGSAAPSGSPSPSATQSAAPELEPQVDGVMIQVLNGTSAVGLAAEVEGFLVGKGYVAALPAADATQKPVETTIVYYRTGEDAEQNQVDAAHLAKRYLKSVDASVKQLSAALGSDVAPKTQLVVLLGNDYADANPVG